MITDVRARVAAALAGEGVTLHRAPGRVNLMGDHTDYSDGFVLPLAIDRECVIAARPTTDGRVRVRSLDEDEAADVAADGSDEPASVEPAWGRYVAGVVRSLARRGATVTGLDAVLASTVPAGSGLSSSAALEVAVALALADAAGAAPGPVELARACREAEHEATGVPSGIMDQLASLAGAEGAALLLDCRSLEHRLVPIPDDLAVVVVHSGVSRTLAGSAYRDRKEASERAAAELGLPALRDAREEQVADDPIARHVVRENARVHATAEALRAGDRPALGRLMAESHASLRDDYRVSTPELDALVEALVAEGAVGARVTGAGFGGCVVALADVADAEDVARRASDRYARDTGRGPTPFLCRAAAGAGRLR